MYQSSISINRTYNKPHLLKLLKKFLKKNKKISFKSLKREVSLAKLPEAITERKRDAKIRLQCFFVAIDILRKSHGHKELTINGDTCFEVHGKDKNGDNVFLHLREEKSEHKDRIVYLISTFWKKAK